MTDRLIISQAAPSGTFNVYETPRTIELHVDGIHGVATTGGTVKINFFTRGYPNPEEMKQKIERREVACRMVMRVETLLSIVSFLNKQVDEMKARIPELKALDESAPAAHPKLN